MPNRIPVNSKILLAVILAPALAIAAWCYLSARPLGPAMQYRMEVKGGRNTEVLHLGEPDTELIFNGNEGYVWQLTPIQIGKSDAVVELRIEHLDHNVAFEAARQELQHVQPRRVTLHLEQPLSIPVDGGAPTLLTAVAF